MTSPRRSPRVMAKMLAAGARIRRLPGGSRRRRHHMKVFARWAYRWTSPKAKWLWNRRGAFYRYYIKEAL